MNPPEEQRPPSETLPTTEPKAATGPGEAPGAEDLGPGHSAGPSAGVVELSPDLSEPSAVPVDAAEQTTERGVGGPTFLFFGVVSAVSLLADVSTKAWAEVTMNERGFVPLEVVSGHLNVILAYNRGGAWGLLQNASEVVRKPFFLGVSVAAILFIVSLYGKLHPSQKALKWGLPLVLGGALGNLSDRITRSQVIDFIDYQGNWVLAMNTFIRRYANGWTVTEHWPTFNVADIAICIGVGLMAVDMVTSRRLRQAQMARRLEVEQGPSAPAAPPSV